MVSAFKQDDEKAAEWYRLAAERGDREAMFALAMFALSGRGGPKTARTRRSCSHRPPSSAMPPRPTTSPCSTSRASCSRRISGAPPNCCGMRGRRATRKRNTRWQPSTRKAAACTKDVREAARLLGAAALADNLDAEVEYSASRCSTAPASPRTKTAPRRFCQGGPARQPDRAEPAGLRVCERPRRAGRSGRRR